jgi:hypothetical protein
VNDHTIRPTKNIAIKFFKNQYYVSGQTRDDRRFYLHRDGVWRSGATVPNPEGGDDLRTGYFESEGAAQAALDLWRRSIKSAATAVAPDDREGKQEEE